MRALAWQISANSLPIALSQSTSNLVLSVAIFVSGIYLLAGLINIIGGSEE